ncbi:hypothetical protein [Deinococcus sp. QL22]|uniref:hypothetical protein n=1 Tax=Deinococcus sp. QL22 TaxID=2939437 RepID=UPI002017AA8F|nr:hypothetical protein [Deinococcus sp. QL22]UQN07972.1 hypothetical protein M1R55_17900 [Deinococcus sp. QL22]
MSQSSADEPITELMSLAAVEVLDALSLLSVSMAATTRHAEAGRLLQTMVGCRMVELLEIYVRRVLELVFERDPGMWSASPKEKILLREALTISREELIARARESDARRIAGLFEDAQEILPRYLRAKPFTDDQLSLFIDLKEQRNLFVHNNGRVDHAYRAKYPQTQLGQQLDYVLHIIQSSTAVFASVCSIDALLLIQYPELGTDTGWFRPVMQERMSHASQVMAPSQEESVLVNDLLPQVLTFPSPFTIPAHLLPENMVAGMGTFWIVQEEKAGWVGQSADGRVVGWFEDRASTFTWLLQPELPWLDRTVIRVEGTWTYGQVGRLEVRWPSLLWPQAVQ